MRAINDSKDISAKLSQIQVAIEAARHISRLLPAGSEIQEQTAQLEEMRTALANDALHLRVNELSTKLHAETDDKQRVKLGQQILALLTHEKEKQLADPRLIAHYESTVQQFLEALQQATISERVSENENCPMHISEMIVAHHGLVDFSLKNNLPQGVRFYQRTDTMELPACGQAMFDISFKIKGYQISPQDLTHDLGRSLLQTIQGSIRKRASSVRCPEHGSAPKIVVTGHSLSDLSWQAPGCCPKLLDVVKQKLNRSS